MHRRIQSPYQFWLTTVRCVFSLNMQTLSTHLITSHLISFHHFVFVVVSTSLVVLLCHVALSLTLLRSAEVSYLRPLS